MHSSIFEVSRFPVPVFERAKAGNLPDWFYEQVCDYAENPDIRQRKEAIERFSKHWGNLCTQNGDRLIISPKVREVHFRKSYCYFKAAAEALSQTDYEVFTGNHTTAALHLALDGLNDSYEDKRGVYIYSAETGQLVTLDRWIRTTDLSNPFYIGGTVNYHC